MADGFAISVPVYPGVYSLVGVAFMAAIYSGLNIQVTKDIVEVVKKALPPGVISKPKLRRTSGPAHEETFHKAHIRWTY